MEYKFWLKIGNLKPVRFYRYTSGVSYVILKQSHNYKTEEHSFLEELGNQLRSLIPQNLWDNKVVVECEMISEHPSQKAKSNIFIGKSDNCWKVGLGVWSDDWVEPINL